MIDYLIDNEWSIVEEGFDKTNLLSSESIFSLGNGKFGQRANFEEDYTGESIKGNYISGIYYPDATKVGWWKKGYPKYFARTVNCPVWIGIKVIINNEILDLNTCKSILSFRRELNMKEGWLKRNFTVEMQNGAMVKVTSKRFISLSIEEIGAIQYDIKPLNEKLDITIVPNINIDVKNHHSNWNEKFLETTSVKTSENQVYVFSKVLKTDFELCTFATCEFYIDNIKFDRDGSQYKDSKKIGAQYDFVINKGETLSTYKYGGYLNSSDGVSDEFESLSKVLMKSCLDLGFKKLLKSHSKQWEKIWYSSDITIKGDIKSQQAIRFNIFHLNQTYTGKNSKSNVSPKGFTGEKYGGVTYWDTEAYCIPFYHLTKGGHIAKNLLKYRYNHLDKAIENAAKVGFVGGAALYPMVTANGEECHNEWEITFEEIHRNSAIAIAIRNYVDFSNDQEYLYEMGLEILIAISRFWSQRISYSSSLNQYVILGVTGPNEYENNVDNNWYTNYSAKWCLYFTRKSLKQVEENSILDFKRIISKTDFKMSELERWSTIEKNIYLPFSEDLDIYIQNDGFLNKELIPANEIPIDQRPINQNWSWDRILRSPYIKQADILQGFYFFEDDFSKESLKKHYDFYEKYTVHESSLSPCIHCIQSLKLDYIEKAYDYFLRTARLDLNDYNKEVQEGLHITSMAGTWMSIVYGFAGLKISENRLSFTPRISNNWEEYSFRINFRNRVILISVSDKSTTIDLLEGEEIEIILNNKHLLIPSNKTVNH